MYKRQDVGLLLAVGPDQGVDLLGVDVVHLLDGLLDLHLASPLVDDEDEGVVLLDLLHGGLGGEWVLKDRIPVEPVWAGAVLAWVLALTRLGESLWKVETNVGTDLLLDSLNALGDSLSDTLSFGLAGF